MFLFMNATALKIWIEKNGPQGASLLSHKTGISVDFIRKLLKGANCSLEYARKISDATGIGMDELSEPKPEPKSKKKSA